jgi:Flp pilus assembly protein TadG
MTKNTNAPTERGQSLIEFAFMMVLLLIMLGGIVDTTRALFTYLSMRDAAQEGALYASFNPNDTMGIQQRVHDSSNLMQSLDADGADKVVDISVTPTVAGKLCAGVSVSSGITTTNGMIVSVEYPEFPLTMPFINTLVGGDDTSVPISVTVVESIISPPCP